MLLFSAVALWVYDAFVVHAFVVAQYAPDLDRVKLVALHIDASMAESVFVVGPLFLLAVLSAGVCALYKGVVAVREDWPGVQNI